MFVYSKLVPCKTTLQFFFPPQACHRYSEMVQLPLEHTLDVRGNNAKFYKQLQELIVKHEQEKADRDRAREAAAARDQQRAKEEAREKKAKEDALAAARERLAREVRGCDGGCGGGCDACSFLLLNFFFHFSLHLLSFFSFFFFSFFFLPFFSFKNISFNHFLPLFFPPLFRPQPQRRATGVSFPCVSFVWICVFPVANFVLCLISCSLILSLFLSPPPLQNQ